MGRLVADQGDSGLNALKTLYSSAMADFSGCQLMSRVIISIVTCLVYACRCLRHSRWNAFSSFFKLLYFSDLFKVYKKKR